MIYRDREGRIINGAPSHSPTLLLIIANVVFYIIQLFIARSHPDFLYQLELSSTGISEGKFWQLITFQFLHSLTSITHVIFNCIGIFVFGRLLEQSLRPPHFYNLYFCSGIIGGLFQVLAAKLHPELFGGSVVGASAGVFGLMAAFATLHPDTQIVSFIGFIPIPMKARTMLIVSGVSTVYMMFFTHSNVAQAAHLGGLVTGLIYIHWVLTE